MNNHAMAQLRSALLATPLLMLFGSPTLRAAPSLPSEATDFLDRYCSSCHNDVDKEAGLDLTSM